MKLMKLTLAALVLMAAAPMAVAQSTFKSKLPVKPSKGVTVAGIVECDGKPVAGVKVSDGYEMTRTDKKGAYYLKSKKQNPQVFICTPAGYEPMREDVVPQYWADFTAAPDQYERHDFRLNKKNQDKHAVVMVTDLHLANQRNDVPTFTGYAERLKKEISDLQSRGYDVMSFHLGDGSWDQYWYMNDFPIQRLRDTFNRVKYPVPLYNIMGNHDNNGGEVWTETKNMDFEAAKPFMKAFGPRYFSFDKGKVHYIFLDNIVYKNELTEKEKTPGIAGKRNFSEKITSEQFEWLKKDLADVSPETPIVLAMHCPLSQYKKATDVVEPKLSKESGEKLKAILAPYKNIHIVSGHTHRQNFTRDSAHNIIDHNINAASGATWWTNGFNCKSFCMDGNPGGFQIFTMDGPEIKWRHYTWDYEPDRSFLAFDMNEVKKYFENNDTYKAYVKDYPGASDLLNVPENEVYINIFEWDPLAKLKVTENGKELPVTMFMGENPNFAATNMLQRTMWLNQYPKSPKKTTTRMFKVTASDATSPLEISYTDVFGNEFKETFNRPNTYTYDKLLKK